MKIIFSFILVLSIKVISAQTLHTIDFKKITFKEALELSAKTGKPIFVDCYTSWCAPCKKMEQTVFVNDSVYKFYNEHFINFKIDMEKGEGVELKKKYEVASFPTYLFVDSRGQILHRTASLMPVKDFLNEGKRALNPNESYANIKTKYEAGDRSNMLLYNYAKALHKINRQEYQKIQNELLSKITDEELLSVFGWQVIQQMAMSETDRLGKYLLVHQNYFEKITGNQDIQTVLNRLRMSMMYQLIREKKEDDFFAKLKEMKNDSNPLTQRNVVMLEMEYYLETDNVPAFVLTSQNAMKGILEQSDVDLSFIARRANHKGKNNRVILNEALLLARKAVSLNPEEYSNQGTLADICFELKLKEEGLVAARKARLLAKESTSKIEKIAQDKLDKMETLD